MLTYPRLIVLCALMLLCPVFLVSAQTTPRYRFASGTRSLGVPFELANNLILLKVRVNNSRPLHFLFDTGASVSVIDPQTARALRLRSQGKLTLEATGGWVQSGLTRPVTLSMQGVSVFEQTLAIIDLDAVAPLFGFKIDGIIGHDFINNFVVEIDYASGVMNLYEPQDYKYSGTGESIPIELVEKTPFARARIVLQGREPVAGKFEVDTGGTGILSLNTPFVNKHKLLETLAKPAQSKLGGAGGTSEAVKAHVEAVELGSLAIKNPLVVFAQGTAGNEGSTESDGELGGGLFSEFKLILDYSRSQVILERNPARANDRTRAAKDLSGLEIVAEPPRFRTYVVNQVAENSPAAAAGIQEEDTILSIDNRPTSHLTLRSLRLILTHPGDHLLSIKRGPKTLQFRMRL